MSVDRTLKDALERSRTHGGRPSLVHGLVTVDGVDYSVTVERGRASALRADGQHSSLTERFAAVLAFKAMFEELRL